MKNILVSLLILLIASASNANELENTLNKVYDKGSKIAEGYISDLLSKSGPGDTEVSFGTKSSNKPTGTIMIVRPLAINENSVHFYQAQLNSYHVQGVARQSLNYGLGKRYLSDDKSHFWGVNTFIDLDTKFNSRLGFGSEFRASAFNVNGNYYIDVPRAGNKVDDNLERVLDGYDLNIAGQVPYTPWANVKYNNYTWKANKATQDSEGEIYSAMVNLSNHLTFEFGRDDNEITQNSNYVKWIYNMNSRNRSNWNDGFSSTAFQDSDVSENMLTKVKRSNIVTLEIENSGVVIANGN